MIKKLSILTAAAITSLYAQSSTTLSVGTTYSEGDYGTENTTKSYYVPVVATYQQGMFSASVTVPYIRIDSEGSFTWTSGGPVPISPAKPNDFSNVSTNSLDPFNPPSGTTTTQTKTQTDGLGDIILNVGYTFIPLEGLYLKTSALMKVATADEKKGLGTGEHDYSAQVDIFKMLTTNAYIFLLGGYTFTGDSDITEYNDVWYASSAVGYYINKSLSFGVNYSFRQALFDTIDDTQSISPYLSYKLSNSLKVDLNYVHGLSDTTADNSYTLTLSQTF